jgi:hypothetical protein
MQIRRDKQLDIREMIVREQAKSLIECMEEEILYFITEEHNRYARYNDFDSLYDEVFDINGLDISIKMAEQQKGMEESEELVEIWKETVRERVELILYRWENYEVAAS